MSEGAGRYRKRPLVVDAIQFTGANAWDWAPGMVVVESPAFTAGTVPHPHLRIQTLEGSMEAHAGDWVIRGVAGEYYPCQDAIFQQTYEPA